MTELQLPLQIIRGIICDANGFDIETGIKPNWEDSGAEHWADRPGELYVERSEEEALKYAEYAVLCVNSHVDMYQALDEARKTLTSLPPDGRVANMSLLEGRELWYEQAKKVHAQVIAALKKANGK